MIRKDSKVAVKGRHSGQVAFVADCSDSPLLPNSVRPAGHHTRVCTFATLPDFPCQTSMAIMVFTYWTDGLMPPSRTALSALWGSWLC